MGQRLIQVGVVIGCSSGGFVWLFGFGVVKKGGGDEIHVHALKIPY